MRSVNYGIAANEVAYFEADVTNRLAGYVPIHLTICQPYKKGEANLNITHSILF